MSEVLEMAPVVERSPKSDRLIGLSRTVWLHLLKEGGRWTSAEVSKMLKLDAKRVSTVLSNMADSGAVVRFAKGESSKSRVRFAVTSACNVPRDVSISQVLANVSGDGDE